MDRKGALRVCGTWRNELVAEEEAVEESCSVSIVVAAEAVIHIDMENHMTGKNYTEKMIVESAVVEHLDKVMDVVAVEKHRMMNYRRKIEDYSANTVAEAEKPFYPSGS